MTSPSRRAISTFTELGLDVLIPLTESAAYDLAVDDAGIDSTHSVQVPSSAVVDLRNIHSNSQGYVVKFLEVEAYDWLYVLHADGREFILKECLVGRRGISIVKMTALRRASLVATTEGCRSG